MRSPPREPAPPPRSWIQYPPMPLAALDDQQQLTDRVLVALREAITSGRLPADARIKQEQIAAELGVSRTPVREALHLLEQEGLVRLVPRRGALVQGFTRRRRARALRAARAARARRRRARDRARDATRSAQAVQRLARRSPSGAAAASSPTATSTARSARRAATASSCARSTRCGRTAPRTGSSPTRRGPPAPSSAWPPSTPRSPGRSPRRTPRACAHSFMITSAARARTRSSACPGTKTTQAEEIS